MSIKAILFDLDGTLLPMDQDVFVKYYLGLLAKKLAPHGYDSVALVDAIWAGTKAMVKNDGSKTNEAAFWEDFAGRYGEKVRKHFPIFEEFYGNEFQGTRAACGYNPKAAETIATIKKMGFRIALATNPLFPSIATKSRISWAGLNKTDFEFFTTYENSCHCKPNPAYYLDVVAKLGLTPEECVMVGNDVNEDMIANTLGMKVFLLTDCLINKENKDISVYPNGGFDELMEYLNTLQ